MNVFNIDYTVGGLPTVLTPVRLRIDDVRMAWLAAMLSAVKATYDDFMANRAANLYYLSHNSQVCYMEAVLNDTFDPSSRGIYIADGPFFDPVFVYLDIEEKPVYIDLVSEIGTHVIDDPDPVPLYTDAETYYIGPQFIVMVPAAVAAAWAPGVIYQLRALVDKYRLVSKNSYIVQTY